MSFKVDKALNSRIVFLSGDEDLLRREAVDELLSAAGVARDDFDLEFTDGSSSTPSGWAGAVSTVPFLSERRILVVRNVLRADLDLAQSAGFANLPESALLVLVADEESSASGERSQKSTTARTKWEKLVTSSGGYVEQFKVDAKEAKETVRKKAALAGKPMSDRAADVLLEMTGASVSRALGELDKVIIFAGNNQQIREDDIRDVVVPSREYNVFKMVDAIVAGTVPEALRQLRILVGSAAKAEDAGIGRVLPMMSRTLRLLWQARLCIENNCPPANPTAAVREMLPAKPNIIDEKPYRLSSYIALAKRADLTQFAQCMTILSETDARLKGALPSFNGMETLERMVLDMADALSPKRAAA